MATYPSAPSPLPSIFNVLDFGDKTEVVKENIYINNANIYGDATNTYLTITDTITYHIIPLYVSLVPNSSNLWSYEDNGKSNIKYVGPSTSKMANHTIVYSFVQNNATTAFVYAVAKNPNFNSTTNALNNGLGILPQSFAFKYCQSATFFDSVTVTFSDVPSINDKYYLIVMSSHASTNKQMTCRFISWNVTI